MPKTVTLVRFVRHPIPWYKEFQSWEGSVGRDLWRTTLTCAAQARLEAPSPTSVPRNRTGQNYATGELVSSIVPHRDRNARTGDPEGQVATTAEHGLMLHDGTGPHTIRPRNGPYLVFFWRKIGRVVRLPEVKHPGTTANPFLSRALTRAIRRYIT